MLWIALVIPDLSLQVFARGTAELGPLGVCSAQPKRLVAVSRTAFEHGVRPGDTVTAACALLPALTLVDRDPALESATLDELAVWAGSFTPSVSIALPDAILLEVSACLRLFQGARNLMDRLESGLHAMGLQARLACAPTPLAAQWLAMAQAGVIAGRDAGWAACLDALPVGLLCRDTSVSTATLELLQGIGIRTIGEARRLPREGLARRQAGEVVRSLARARGETPDPRPWFTPPGRFEAGLALPLVTRTIEPLLFAAGRLVAGMVVWLEGLQAAGDRFELMLDHEDGTCTTIEVVTGEATRDAGRLMMLAREHLAAKTLQAPVEALRLRTDSPVSRAAHTPDLFGDPGQIRESATLLVDRLRARLGKQAVKRIRPWPDHRPELAWREADGDVRIPATGPFLPARPAWLLKRPRELESVRRLRLLNGPERIESGWWDGRDVRRDYFVARAPDAGLWWIFRDLEEGGRWYLHGYFG